MHWWFGFRVSWKNKTIEWQVCNLWGFHGLYYGKISWTRKNGSHKTLFTRSRGRGAL